MQSLATITPGGRRAFLVEAFNRILISKIRFAGAGEAPPFQRGIKVFEEKDDLLPFEEAKLYGHNATHALAAYVGAMRGVERIADLSKHPDIFAFLRAAFIQESGEALVRKHAGKDPLFTHEGYREYADDLLARMVNPFLHDSVGKGWARPAAKTRLGRPLGGNPARGVTAGHQAITLCLRHSSRTRRAGSNTLETNIPLETWLDPLWQTASPDKKERGKVLALIEEGRHRLQRWRESGFQNLEDLFSRQG